MYSVLARQTANIHLPATSGSTAIPPGTPKAISIQYSGNVCQLNFPKYGTLFQDVSYWLIVTCQFAIAMTGIHWLAQRETLQFSIAVGALVVSLLPPWIFHDPLLRTMASTLSALVLAAHIVLGMFGELYETSLVYDKVIHTTASAAVATLLTIAVQRYCVRNLIKLPLVLVSALVLGGTLSAGTLWELFEFTIDRTGLFNAQRGLVDTMYDLTANTVGGCLIAGLILSDSITSMENLASVWKKGKISRVCDQQHDALPTRNSPNF